MKSIKKLSSQNVALALVFFALGLAVLLFSFPEFGEKQDQKNILACNESESCMQDLFVKKVGEKGLAEGFGMLKRMYVDTPDFRGKCFGFAVTLTDTLYSLYPDYSHFKLTPDVVTCNYGFLQQYPKSILLATKDPQQAKRFCSYVADSIGRDVPGAAAECYRGIGRGLPFIDAGSGNVPEKMAAFAVRNCKNLAPDATALKTCLSGVFNSLGRSEVLERSGLIVDTNNPMRLCEALHDQESREPCFGNFKVTLLSLVHGTTAAQMQSEIEKLYGVSASSSVHDAIWMIGYEWARTKLVEGGEFKDGIEFCNILSLKNMHFCIQGMSVGIAKHASPGNQHILLTSFCKVVRASVRGVLPADCPSMQALGYLKGFYSPEKFRVAYRYMQRKLTDLPAPDTFQNYGY